MSGKQPVVLVKLESGAIDDTNYADVAEACIKRLRTKDRNGKPSFGGLTTTKLRSLYGYIMNIYTRINEPDDFAAHRGDLQYLKVRMAYEAGREDAVRRFLEASKLRELVSCVKTYDQFLVYCRYAESLVAYFKFYGGEDN